MQACAVMVDAENTSYKSLHFVLDRLNKMGYNPQVRQAFADWRKTNLKPYKNIEKALSFTKIDAPSYVSGKGTSDAAMIVGAMDILQHHPLIKCFALVTSDSDFTPLVTRLNQAGKVTIGFGFRQTPSALVKEYQDFVLLNAPTTTSRKAGMLTEKDIAKKAGELTTKEDLIESLPTTRLNESGKEKVGCATQQTPNALVEECEAFVLLDAQTKTPKKAGKLTKKKTATKAVKLKKKKIAKKARKLKEKETAKKAGKLRKKETSIEPLSKTCQNESGKLTVGFGMQQTPNALVEECENIVLLNAQTKTPKKAGKLTKEEILIESLSKTILQKSRKTGWVWLSLLNKHFKFRKYGYTKMSKFFDANTDHFELSPTRQSVRMRTTKDNEIRVPANTTKEVLIEYLSKTILQKSSREGYILRVSWSASKIKSTKRKPCRSR